MYVPLTDFLVKRVLLGRARANGFAGESERDRYFIWHLFLFTSNLLAPNCCPVTDLSCLISLLSGRLRPLRNLSPLPQSVAITAPSVFFTSSLLCTFLWPLPPPLPLQSSFPKFPDLRVLTGRIFFISVSALFFSSADMNTRLSLLLANGLSTAADVAADGRGWRAAGLLLWDKLPLPFTPRPALKADCFLGKRRTCMLK